MTKVLLSMAWFALYYKRMAHRFLYLIVAVASWFFSLSSVAEARPLDPPFQVWPSDRCLTLMADIISHEIGHGTLEQIDFVAYNVRQDALRLGCYSLTDWRWKIGSQRWHSTKVLSRVSLPLIGRRCNFIGSTADVQVWRAAGYRARVDVTLRGNGLTVIGADCE